MFDEVRESNMIRGIWSSYVVALPYAVGLDFEEAVDNLGIAFLLCCMIQKTSCCALLRVCRNGSVGSWKLLRSMSNASFHVAGAW